MSNSNTYRYAPCGERSQRGGGAAPACNPLGRELGSEDPPAPPYDFQPLPCQKGFAGKAEVEIGIASAGIYPPGVNSNQGPNACGGAGCPNDAIITLRFLPNPHAAMGPSAQARTGPPSTPKGHGGQHVLMIGHGRSCERPGTPVTMLREAARVIIGAGAAC